MGELIFFAVIILFSILESIARARKQREQEGEQAEHAPREQAPRGRPPIEREWDEDAEPASAEGMIPRDIWEEIEGLVRGEAPRPEPTPAERRTPSTRTPSTRTTSSPTHTAPPSHSAPPASYDAAPTYDTSPTYDDEIGTPRPPHRLHRIHPELGTDPSGRAPSELDWRPVSEAHRNAERVRAVLRGSEGKDALKEAFILREVLGPPAALRDD